MTHPYCPRCGASARRRAMRPMSDDLRTRIAETQKAHRLLPINEGYACSCGWQAAPPPPANKPWPGWSLPGAWEGPDE